jgi:hypothetical protein
MRIEEGAQEACFGLLIRNPKSAIRNRERRTAGEACRRFAAMTNCPLNARLHMAIFSFCRFN